MSRLLVSTASLAASAALLLFTQANAHAQTPSEPTPSATPALELTVRFDDNDTFSWNAIDGAIGYTIQGNAFVIRTNAANPICQPPLVAEERNVNITGTFGADTTSYRLELQLLPPEDSWFVVTYSVSLVALGPEQTQPLATTRIGGIAESTCPHAVPTPLSEPLAVGDCVIPAGSREVTTPAAQERGQRVFESADHVTRIYVRADGSCVTLHGAVPPVPEFAPEGQSGLPGQPSMPGVSALPATGSDESSRLIRLVGLLVGAGVTALALGAISSRLRS